MAISTIILQDLAKDMDTICRLGGVQNASLGLLHLEKRPGEQSMSLDSGVRSVQANNEPRRAARDITYEAHERGDEIFPIASLTKILVGVAFLIATKVEAPRNVRFQRFHGALYASITELYNKYEDNSQKHMAPLPGTPRCDQLLTHFHGIPSSNHRVLGPDGGGIMTLEELRQDVYSMVGSFGEGKSKEVAWIQYSNVNHALIGMIIEHLWQGSLGSFMKAVLFDRLEMTSTSIGFSATLHPYAGRYVVDSTGRISSAEVREYSASGAEAAAMGGYSSAKDMLRFFEFVLRTYNGECIIDGVESAFIGEAMGQTATMNSPHSDPLQYTPLGIFTSLRSRLLGSMSINRLLFPDESFSNYRVVWKPKAKGGDAYYHAGSAVGCHCCFALVPGSNVAVVVLTNTSGSVDAADHLLRQALRTLTRVEPSNPASLAFARTLGYKRVTEYASLAAERMTSLSRHREALVRNYSPAAPPALGGPYSGVGFSQRLWVTGGRQRSVTVVGGGGQSGPFPLRWISDTEVQISIPLHRSIDCLQGADWGNLIFHVEVQDRTVVALWRKTMVGMDRFERQLSQTRNDPRAP